MNRFCVWLWNYFFRQTSRMWFQRKTDLDVLEGAWYWGRVLPPVWSLEVRVRMLFYVFCSTSIIRLLSRTVQILYLKNVNRRAWYSLNFFVFFWTILKQNYHLVLVRAVMVFLNKNLTVWENCMCTWKFEQVQNLSTVECSN